MRPCAIVGSMLWAKISLLDDDAIPKRLESIRRANKCRHRMTVFNRLPDDLHSRAPCGTQYN